MSESREELEKRLDKRRADFKVEITEMCNKFEQVTIQLYQTLAKLEASFQYGYPPGYGDVK